jgi:hypothetical protein
LTIIKPATFNDTRALAAKFGTQVLVVFPVSRGIAMGEPKVIKHYLEYILKDGKPVLDETTRGSEIIKECLK